VSKKSDSLKEILERLLAQESILITSHVRPDGDSLGVMSAMYSVLRTSGKDCCLFCDGPIPEMYAFLPHMERMNGEPAVEPTAALVLDCAGLDRVGAVRERITPDMEVLNIDHHPDNTFFGKHNHVDLAACSTAELVYNMLREGGLAIDEPTAVALYTGLVTDTGGFCHANTNAETFRISADLIERGLDVADVMMRLYKNTPRGVFRLRAAAMANMRFALDGQVAYFCITSDTFKATGTRPADTQGFSDIPRSVKGVKVGIFFREETGPGDIRVSIRSNNEVKANEIARLFGGGGHYRAAGCQLQCSLDEATERVLREVCAVLSPSGPSQ